MLCTSCFIRPPNPRRSWCEHCYQTKALGGFGVAVGVCKVCKIRPPNNGRSWCEQCYQSITGGGNVGSVNPVCKICQQRPPNPGYSLCQQCYANGGVVGAAVGVSVNPVCKICQQKPPNPGYSWCQQCYANGGVVGAAVGGGNVCKCCKQRPPNPGYSWCQQCYANGGVVGAAVGGGKMCKNCRMRPPNPGYGWCQQCFSVTSGNIVLKPVDQAKFQSVKNQFDVGMSKKGGSHTILAIYSVWDANRNRDYTNYKNSIVTKNGGDANEKRWWHGSHLRCNLMNTMKLCNGSSCSICGILRKGFLLNFSLKNFGWGRFGPGLYFAPDAAKSNDYAKSHNGIKCLILCKVVVGKPIIYKNDQQHLRGVPPGYDSILGEVGPVLNFPELVLYDEDAVLPSYVVFYQ